MRRRCRQWCRAARRESAVRHGSTSLARCGGASAQTRTLTVRHGAGGEQMLRESKDGTAEMPSMGEQMGMVQPAAGEDSVSPPASAE